MIKVLAIDGGGIRGIIPARLLAEIEKRTQKATVELFDLIAGTSTGGILALGLNKPDLISESKPAYSAQQLVDLYEQKGAEVFRPDLLEGIWTSVGSALHPKYSHQGLEKVLNTYFGNIKLSESLKDILITSYDLERRRPYIFLSSEAKKRVDLDFPMKLVGRATSAAPTYFEPLKLNKPGTTDYYALVDGGVYANNPALYAYTEVQRLYQNIDDCLIVSLGTGEQSRRIPYEEVRHWGVTQWSYQILDVVFSGVNDAANSQLQQLMPEDKYFRIQPKLLGIDERMDNASPENITALKVLTDNVIHENDKLIDRICSLLLK